MIRLRYAPIGAVILLVAAASPGQAASAPERSVSSSRQFIVYGADARLRGAICDLAERSKRDALPLIGGRDDWQTPIVIEARAPEIVRPAAPVAELHVNQTGAGLKFQLELRIPAEVDVAQVERELLRAVLLEMIYRSHPNLPPGTPYVEPPDWLLEGVSVLAPEYDITPVVQTLGTVTAGEMVTLENFLRQKRALLDSPSQAVYRAYSAALVSMLTRSANGNARLARYIGDLEHASSDPFADLVAHFPEIGASAAQIETAWRASVEHLARSESYRLLSCEETERQLTALLRVTIPSADGKTVYGLEDFAKFRRDPATPVELRRLTTDLLLLTGRASTVHRPIISEYQRIAARLLRGKAPKPQRLVELRALREDINRRVNAIADYLNWFEATQPQVTSGMFREFLRAAERTSAPVARRRDPISVYLDALETQF